MREYLARSFSFNMELSKIASAIYNDVMGGLSGMSANPTISLEQLEDEVVEERQTVIKEWFNKGLLKKDDLMIAINCIDVDCADPGKCCDSPSGKSALHFEIPQLLDDLGESAIYYVGSVDRTVPYDVYFSPSAMAMHKYKRRGKDKPYVYIEKTPNVNGMYDGWIFNLPFVKRITVIGMFKDLRQLEEFNCCDSAEFLDFGSVSNEVKSRLTKKKLQYYRQYVVQPQPNNLVPR